MATLAFHVAWTALTVLRENEESYAYVRDPSDIITAETVSNHSIPQPTSKALLAISALLMSLGMLRYMSTSNGIGHYVLMVMAMVWDLR